MNAIANLPDEGFKALIKIDGKIVYYFRYDGVEVKDAEGQDTGTSNYTEACILMKNATYEKMVAECISQKYNTDAQMALLYNYQKDAEKYQADMDAYQEWREYCKAACKEFFGIDE